jgi:hypothetical protein
MTATFLFHVLKNITSTNIAYLFTTYYHASFQGLRVSDSSGAPTTSSFIHYVYYHWLQEIQKYVDINFHENRSTGSNSLNGHTLTAQQSK